MGAGDIVAPTVAKVGADLVSKATTDFSMKGLMELLGNEGFANLIKGGTGLWQGMQMGDMLDFQKDQANIANQRQDLLFKDYEEDRANKQNVNYDFKYANEQ